MKETTLSVTEFRLRCLRLLANVAERGDTIIITKRGKPVARVVPFKDDRKPLKGRWAGLGKTKGDIVSFETSTEWEAVRSGACWKRQPLDCRRR